MSRISMLLTAILALVIGAAAHAETVPIATNNTWLQFDVDDFASTSGGLEWISLDGSVLEFTFTAAEVLLTVVDGGFGGDTFRLFDNGILLGTTSSATNTYPNSVGTNFDAALADGNYSFATFLLAAGTHVITGELLQSALADGSPLNATVGAVRIVPLPASLLLLLSGGGLLGFVRRRCNAVQA